MKFSSKRILRLNKPIHDVIIVSNAAPAAGEDDSSPETLTEKEPDIQISPNELEEKISSAYQQGKEEGNIEGYSRARAEFSETFQVLQKLIDDFDLKQREILEKSEKTVLNLLFRMITKIVPTVSAQQSDMIETTLRKLLKSYQSAGRIKIALNPGDLEKIRKVESDIRAQFPDIKELSLFADPAISPGGCVMETDMGKIDARIETQLDEMEKELKKTLLKL